MPFIEVTTREPIPLPTKEALAKAMSNTMLDIEIGGPTEAACLRDWIWFRVLQREDWAVGGRFDDTYLRGRTTCFARIIAPDAFLDTDLKLRAIAEITAHLRDVLVVDPADDGTGIWVHVVEAAQGRGALGGSPDPLLKLNDGMDGTVSRQRLAEIEAHFAGINELKDAFSIPK
ncbi:tautomerase family protein [Paraburkholderia tropica]|uniref:tautomerase family protein n=1 Tax=Paraburkholderia tropica TaxID=92647 RepID=UPI0007EDACE1|nr:hypothetical protein [Paraburkholderia tropica]OBR49205.1 hypothetical protein A6456_36120 [Paraburkholderia tropica]